MAQGRCTKIISMIKWIRTSRLSIQNSLSDKPGDLTKSPPETGWRVSIRGAVVDTETETERRGTCGGAYRSLRCGRSARYLRTAGVQWSRAQGCSLAVQQTWNKYASQGQILEQIRQSRPDSGTNTPVKARFTRGSGPASRTRKIPSKEPSSEKTQRRTNNL